MRLGDHLISHRRGYSHHGIYVGRGQVIHYAGFVRGFETGQIERTSMYGFTNGRNVHVADDQSVKFTRAEIVERAYSKLGEDQYNVLLNNCEHFVHWCLHGRKRSPQVERGVARVKRAVHTHFAIEAMRDPAVQKQLSVLATRHLPAPASKVVRKVLKKVASKPFTEAACTIPPAATTSLIGLSSISAVALPPVAIATAALSAAWTAKEFIDWITD